MAPGQSPYAGRARQMLTRTGKRISALEKQGKAIAALAGSERRRP